MSRRKGEYNPSRTSPRNSRRACLCEDGTYSRKCCCGNMINQGIGQERGQSVSASHLLQENGDRILTENNNNIIL